MTHYPAVDFTSNPAAPGPLRPPLGPRPRVFWLRDRVMELSRAIHEYAAHRDGTTPRLTRRIEEWAAELAQVAAELHDVTSTKTTTKEQT